MTLKIATVDDIHHMMCMVNAFHKASPYKSMKMDYDEVDALLRDIVSSDKSEKIALLKLNNFGVPIALVGAHAVRFAITGKRMAMELIWWVDPQFRTANVGKELLDAYEYWAKNVANCDHARLCTLVNGTEKVLDRVYKKRGYNPLENNYLKEL